MMSFGDNVESPVLQLRVALTARDYERVLTFYQEALGLAPAALWENDGGHAVEAAVKRAVSKGATLIHEPVMTPWGDYNARLSAPDGMQITLFQTPDRT
jgi:predicted enzyme related to lactoylglutathione lyase